MKKRFSIKGNTYACNIHGNSESLPYLLMLHGFMGDHRAFSHLLDDLAKICNPVTVDLLGHGDSDKPADPAKYHEEEQISHIISLIHEIDISSLFLYGYSMGGRLALKTAQAAPELFTGLILESTTYGIIEDEKRIDRRETDKKRAADIKEDFKAFLNGWKDLPLFASPARVSTELSNTYKRIHAEQEPLALAAAIQGFSTGLMKPVTKNDQNYYNPVLLVAGSKDQKYIAINKELQQILPKAKLKILEAGHRVHLDNPGDLAEEIKLFIEQNSQKMDWKTVKEFDDITFKKSNGVARIAFNRPEIRNAFRPKTLFELQEAFLDVREDQSIGVVLLSGEGPSPKDGKWAFCSGGDQNVRDKLGYKDDKGTARLNVLDLQRLIRFMGKVVIAVVPGWAVGGGHSLHVVCDLTIASKEHAIFKQTDADVASFDGGFGSALLARQVGQKRAREIFFLGRNYSAQEAYEMGMVNAVVPHEELEETAYQWAQEILQKSPTAIRMIKFAFNLVDDGMVGQQVFSGEATRLAYMTDEAKEGRDAFLEKRKPNWEKFPWIG